MIFIICAVFKSKKAARDFNQNQQNEWKIRFLVRRLIKFNGSLCMEFSILWSHILGKVRPHIVANEMIYNFSMGFGEYVYPGGAKGMRHPVHGHTRRSVDILQESCWLVERFCDCRVNSRDFCRKWKLFSRHVFSLLFVILVPILESMGQSSVLIASVLVVSSTDWSLIISSARIVNSSRLCPFSTKTLMMYWTSCWRYWDEQRCFALTKNPLKTPLINSGFTLEVGFIGL